MKINVERRATYSKPARIIHGFIEISFKKALRKTQNTQYILKNYFNLFSNITILKLTNYSNENNGNVHPFIPNATFLYPLKTSEILAVFWCFHGVEKGHIGNKCVNKTLRKIPKFHVVSRKRGRISVFYAVIVIIMTIIKKNLNIQITIRQEMSVVI